MRNQLRTTMILEAWKNRHVSCIVQLIKLILVSIELMIDILLRILVNTADSRIGWGNCVANDSQREISETRSSSTKRSPSIRSSWNRENTDGPCLCSPDKCYIFEASRSPTRSGTIRLKIIFTWTWCLLASVFWVWIFWCMLYSYILYFTIRFRKILRAPNCLAYLVDNISEEILLKLGLFGSLSNCINF